MIKTIKIPLDKEVVVVGDIHENEWHFNKLLERAEIGTKRILISVGDVYDKGEGPHIAERIIDKIKDLSDSGWAYMVRGNHEEMNIKKSDKLTPQLEWCRQLPLSLSFVFENQIRITIVHAGVAPHHSWDDLENNKEVMYIRTIDEHNKLIPMIWKDKDGKRERLAAKNGVVWHEKYDGRFGYILSGHDSQRDGKVKKYKYSCNLDTRCYDTGILAAQIISNGTLGDLLLIER